MLGQVTTSALSGDAFKSNSAPCDDAAALDEDEAETCQQKGVGGYRKHDKCIIESN